VRSLSSLRTPDLQLTPNRGDPSAHEKFVQVSEAYEALSDPESRQIYDQFGHEGLKQRKQGNGFQHHDPFDLFSRFFGGGGHFNTHPGQRRGPNIEVKVSVSLKDFYNGGTTEFTWDKQEICEHCAGTGAADKVVHTCPSCGGKGVKMVRSQFAPGMFTQVQMQCDACGGRGKTIAKRCPVCHGDRVVRKATPVTVQVERGMGDGTRVVYENEADASPDWVAGDLIVTLVEKEPELEEGARPEERVDGVFFRRRGDDLFWTEVLSLREALLGDWSRNITHLDGHVVRLGRKRGQVVQPGHVDTIPGEGMPVWHEDGDSVYHKTEYGNLYVEYVVVLPDQMESGMEKDLWAVFEKWRAKKGVNLHKDSGRPEYIVTGERPPVHEEL